jgi:hypothetical protein
VGLLTGENAGERGRREMALEFSSEMDFLRRTYVITLKIGALAN